jgi:hypothetical protein
VEGIRLWVWKCSGMLASAPMRTLLTASALVSQYCSDRALFVQTSNDLFWNSIHIYFCFQLLHFIVAGQIQFLSEASRDKPSKTARKNNFRSVKPAADQQKIQLSSENCLITPPKLPYKRNVGMKRIYFWENML